MSHFTPFASLLGGALIGLAASALLLLRGRVAGIVGIVGGIVRPERGEVAWRALFVAGLFTGGLALAALRPELVASHLDRSTLALVVAGLLVGFGARLGGGCTSGHGVCGLSRLSLRSLVAVTTFMTTGAIAAFVVDHVLGGVL